MGSRTLACGNSDDAVEPTKPIRPKCQSMRAQQMKQLRKARAKRHSMLLAQS